MPVRKGDKRGPYERPVKTSIPIMRQLFRLAYEQGVRRIDIAAKLRVKTETVAAWASGRTTPVFTSVEEFANLLGLSVALADKGTVRKLVSLPEREIVAWQYKDTHGRWLPVPVGRLDELQSLNVTVRALYADL